MKKNIVIAVLTLLLAFFAVYAKMKADEAERKVTEAQELAEKYLKAAQQAERLAADQAAKAVFEKHKAEMARDEAERLLADCK